MYSLGGGKAHDLEHEAFNRRPQLILLDTAVRVLDDNVVRAAGYVNAAVQVTGVGGLPFNVRGIVLKITLLATAIGQARIIANNPNFLTGATALGGWAGAANTGPTGIVALTLNDLGQYYFQDIDGMNRTVHDVLGYTI